MVQIADEGLRRALDYNGCDIEDGKIDEAVLAGLTRIDWSATGIGEHDPELFDRIQSLEGLQAATSLTVLSFAGNSLRSLGPIAGHRSLETLWLSDNELVDVSGIAGMSELRVLDLDSNCELRDISALARAPSLALVDLTNTKVTDFSPLLTLARLREVRLWGLEIPEESDGFDTLVQLGMRGVKLVAGGPLERALRAEIGRRKLADAFGDDSVRDALSDAGLDDLASRWVEAGPQGRDDRGNTLLHDLVAADVDDDLRTELTKLAVETGASVDDVQSSYPKTTPLGLAVLKERKPDYLRTLIELGADPNAPPDALPVALALELHDEAVRDDLVGALLAAGADPGLPAALVAISERGTVELVERAIESADDVDAVQDGKTPLARATWRAAEDVMRLLLDTGADPNVPGRAGDTPIFEARDLASYEMLVEAGADPTARRSVGDTVLFEYVRLAESEPEVARLLIERAVADGVDPGARNYEGLSALHALADTYAYGEADANLANLVPVLVELGASVTALATGGRSAVDMASGDAVLEALTAASCAPGETIVNRLTTLLDELESDDESAWAAALELSAALEGEPLQDFTDVIETKLRELPMGASFSVFEPTSAPVVALLAGGVNARGAYGAPVTHLVLKESEYAVEGGTSGKEAALRALLDAGANPYALDQQGHSVLREYLYWVKPWDIGLVKSLIDPSIIHAPRAWSALMTAADAVGSIPEPSQADHEVLDLLVEAGGDLTPAGTLFALCRAGRFDLVRRAVEAGADVTALEGGDTALHHAVRSDAIDVVRYLLEVGVDANLANPLFAVCSVPTLELLLEAGADPLAQTQSGETPLHSIATRWEIDGPTMVALFDRFEELGVARDTPNNFGKTPLESLARREEPEIQALLA